MIALYQKWVDTFPIVSIEDGLDENDWAGFARQTAAQGERIQIVGDDIFVTNPEVHPRGIKEKAANAVLIKLNQIGTVTETIEAIALCRKAGWGYVVSHRSGETEDAFLADFAVAMGGGQIKTGSASRSERIAKYNRLLEIEAELGKAAKIRSRRSHRSISHRRSGARGYSPQASSVAAVLHTIRPAEGPAKRPSRWPELVGEKAAETSTATKA